MGVFLPVGFRWYKWGFVTSVGFEKPKQLVAFCAHPITVTNHHKPPYMGVANIETPIYGGTKRAFTHCTERTVRPFYIPLYMGVGNVQTPIYRGWSRKQWFQRVVARFGVFRRLERLRIS